MRLSAVERVPVVVFRSVFSISVQYCWKAISVNFGYSFALIGIPYHDKVPFLGIRSSRALKGYVQALFDYSYRNVLCEIESLPERACRRQKPIAYLNV